mmetsp:Transcript_35345/g.42547  ORF Transcript_35345/g.42547 Transcript_35345/m.42547 type:complete len:102 (-) Transcript_35345:200-505(-)|eukprot:CAMPEP_0197845864 /NCGR_PEP_ID=MMETSP1438-20131217/2729_1 /TAXON_ID=1461541 /ORGANISM="Pterosperma sp., Strain CCMP1384" /LENGTH=101 /DNA_ID=CAMNT_0043457317 /DNA_START=86 /DNA_END=391 /DNA_ORIENTATION=-
MPFEVRSLWKVLLRYTDLFYLEGGSGENSKFNPSSGKPGLGIWEESIREHGSYSKDYLTHGPVWVSAGYQILHKLHPKEAGWLKGRVNSEAKEYKEQSGCL